MSGKVTLYFNEVSMPSRAILLFLRYLNIDVEIKHIDIFKKEHKTDEFLKINPAGKVPVFVDTDGFKLDESRAILAYLANTRKPGRYLYPTDSKKRALIDQRLYFDATIVVIVLLRPITNVVDQSAIDEAKDVIKLLEGFLSDSQFFAGDKLTIADISILANITTFDAFGFDFSDYPKISAWYNTMKELPGFDENQAGAKAFASKIGKRPFQTK